MDMDSAAPYRYIILNTPMQALLFLDTFLLPLHTHCS